MKSAHRITTYNVLSSSLASPDHFRWCVASHLDKDYRFNKLTEKLLDEISHQAVINLQEVSNEWAGKLSAFFSQHSYHFITALYGHKFNGFMGVGIAIPYAKYSIVDVDICTLGTTLSLPRQPKPSMLTTLYEKCFGKSDPCPYWQSAAGRSNRMITVVLQPIENDVYKKLRSASKKKASSTDSSSDNNFCVSNYHMPCAFYDPPLMTIHCALAAQRARWVAKRATGGEGCLPYILTGDFNIKPHSTMYRLLTEGSLKEPNNPELPVTLPGISWSHEVSPMRSAYAVASSEGSEKGREPDFTNYAQTSDDGPFIDTLDYLFLSEQWEVIDVLALPNRVDVAGPLPNASEPSDHVLLYANLSL